MPSLTGKMTFLVGCSRSRRRDKKVPDLFSHVGQVPLVVGEHQKIIDVADIALDPQPVLDEVIERVEVDVGEELAGLVADGDAPPPFAGREQVVAGELVQDFFLRVAVVDDLADQPQHVRVFDLAGHQFLEDFVVQRREELLDVGLQDVAETAGELLAAVHGGVRAFALATGVGVGNEGRSKIGSSTSVRAWWTTRSRYGAALICRFLGS